MRGSGTRTTILKALNTPRDKFQLATEFGLDWTTIDYHMRILEKHGLVREKVVFGKVKLYELTQTGNSLLAALEEMDQKPA